MQYSTNNQPANNPISVGGSGITMPAYVPVQGPAINQLQKLGLNPGPSPWATLATDQQAKLRANALEQGAQQVKGQTAETEAELAASGGLSSGGRERAAEGGAKNYLAMGQDLTRQQNLNDLQIGENDAQNKLQQLGGVANVEASQNQAMNSYNQNMYQSQMSAWAAQQQANATANAGKK